MISAPSSAPTTRPEPQPLLPAALRHNGFDLVARKLGVELPPPARLLAVGVAISERLEVEWVPQLGSTTQLLTQTPSTVAEEGR